MKPSRKAAIHRKTSETDIALILNIDGTGKYQVKTPLPFLNHMLEALAKHGLFDLTLKAKGDIEVDDHHLVEDIGITLGEAFKKALGDKKGIRRYGHFMLPMDEVLTLVALDFAGRPCLIYDAKIKSGKIKNFDVDLVHEFFQGFVNAAAINLHILVLKSGNKHHVVESIFKAFTRALDMATMLDPRVKNIPSTKGKL
jgi:imidazoleglycerol-phosphate dehydratase